MMLRKLIRRTLLNINVVFLITPLSALASPGDITPTSLPVGLIGLDEEVTITWLESVDVILQAGLSASDWSVTVTADASAPGTLTFRPAAGGLSAGVWTARLLRSGTDESSLPFYLLVEAANAPLMTTPQNGSEIEGGSTLLGWEPVLGVPYHHVIFSDQEIVIEENEDGDAVITGANIIWQVIVPGTSVEYGADDPSDYFDDMNGTPPPLVPGTDYNWLVLNNYGNNPGLTSQKQAGVSSFSVTETTDIPPPSLIAPAADAVLDDDVLTFEWSEVTGASHYHLYLNRMVDSDENEGCVTVFDQLTGQTVLDLPASSMLVDSRYTWRVYALDETGQGAASELREFIYEIDMGTIEIHSEDGSGGNLPFVDVELTALDGGGNPLPIVTGSTGAYDQEILPGSYRLDASKQGYEDTSAEVMISVDQTSSVALVLEASPATVAGMVRSADQSPVPFATVTAVEDITSESRQIQAGSGGSFQLGLGAGLWSIIASQSGYHSEEAVQVEVAPGEFLELTEAVPLLPNSSTIGGSVLSSGGLPMISATVTASKGDEAQQILTGSGGTFLFSLDAGDWTLSASKSGYVSSPPRVFDLDPGEDLTVDPPLTLSAEAAILSGFVQNGDNILAGALVSATPVTGSAQTQHSTAMGSYLFSLNPGTWTLSASLEGYTLISSVQVTLEACGGQSGVLLAMSANPCTVSGFVGDGENGIGGATISSGAGSVQSAWDGGYSISLPAGAQSLEAWRSGYGGGQPVDLDLTPGQVLSGIDFILSPNAATVSGQVRHGGTTVAGATVYLESTEISLVRTCDTGGNFEISVDPGDYSLWAEKEGMDSDPPQEIVLGPGQVLSNRVLGLTPATASLSGKVSSGSVPLRDAVVRADSDAGSVETSSNVDGDWTLVLPSGHVWYLQASKSGYANAGAESPLMASGGSWEHDFDLIAQPALLAGTLSDDDGVDLADVMIRLSGQVADSVRSQADGSYEISLQPGAYNLSVLLPGYADFSRDLNLSVGSQTENITLSSLFASLSGIVSSGNGGPLPGVTLSALSSASGGSASSDGSGGYIFPRLLAGDYQISAELPGFSGFSAVLTLSENEDAVLDLSLDALAAYFSGQVQDEQGAALANVSIQVREGGQILAQGQSDGAGSFQIESLPADIPLTLSASLGAYSPVSANPLTELIAPQSGLSFTLAANTGVIRGIVRDSGTLEPIDDAQVIVDDGAGFYGEGESDAGGAFNLTGLCVSGTYAVTVDAAGWTSTQLSGIAPDGSQNVIGLSAAPASIYGSISLSVQGAPFSMPEGAALRAMPLEGTGKQAGMDIVELGDFNLTQLFPGTYSLILRADGYITEPRSREVLVQENLASGPWDFSLISAPLLSIEVTGEQEIDNSGSYLYFSAMTSEVGEQVDYPVRWSCDPGDAGAIDVDSGRFTPRGNYIGKVTLSALHASSGITGSKAVNVFALLTPTGTFELDNGAGLYFRVPSGSVTQSVSVSVSQVRPSPIKRRAGSYRVEGDIFHFLPDGLVFSEDSRPTLILPIPNNQYNARLAFGWWNPEDLLWEASSGIRWDGGLARELEHFSDYALLAANLNLGVRSAGITPNPFSPEGAQGGSWISFSLSSTEMASPIVDLKIFNMLGDPVRTLLEHEALPVGISHSYLWDGRTEQGDMARNGRYLVRISVEDNSGTEESILQAILIK